MSRSMRHFVDYIGPGYDLFLPHINHFFQQEWSGPWNREIDRLVAERPNVHTWAGDVELANGGYDLDDVVHLSPSSYRRWSLLTAAEVTADLGCSRYFGDNVDLSEPIAEPSRFNPVEPVRLVDTRDDPDTRIDSA